MPRTGLNDLAAFLAVARERSFTRAAAQLGVSQSALSQTIRGLEARLGLRLLTRTARRIAPTEAGEHLLRTVGPRLDEIDDELAALSELRDKPAGTIRITATENAATAVLLPTLAKLLPDYPDIIAPASKLSDRLSCFCIALPRSTAQVVTQFRHRCSISSLSSCRPLSRHHRIAGSTMTSVCPFRHLRPLLPVTIHRFPWLRSVARPKSGGPGRAGSRSRSPGARHPSRSP
jgi:DNA-binding MarR family transcriptional regulator